MLVLSEQNVVVALYLGSSLAKFIGSALEPCSERIPKKF